MGYKHTLGVPALRGNRPKEGTQAPLVIAVAFLKHLICLIFNAVTIWDLLLWSYNSKILVLGGYSMAQYVSNDKLVHRLCICKASKWSFMGSPSQLHRKTSKPKYKKIWKSFQDGQLVPNIYCSISIRTQY